MTKPLFDKVTIVGVGLIGGSLGLAIKKRKLAKLVMGVVHRRQTIARAFRHRALHGATFLKTGHKTGRRSFLCDLSTFQRLR